MTGNLQKLMLSALLGAVALSSVGCSEGDGRDDTMEGTMDDQTGNTQDPGDTPDPNGLLASLEFFTAEHDARYRCLLDRFDAQAGTAGYEAFGPVDFRGDVLKSWCAASGEDGNQCMRGLVLGMNDRGSRGVAVWAFRETPDSVVGEYGYRSGYNPAAGAQGDTDSVWSLDFERTYGSVDRFAARFVPFSGDERDYTSEINVGDRATYATEGLDLDDVLATIEPEGSPSDFLVTLMESSARFAQTLADRQDALLAEYERLIGLRANASEGARSAAIERARAQIGAERTILTDNAEAMHALLRDAMVGEDCG